MTHVHYKFSSKLSYDTAVFDGPHITLRDLKRQIMGREKLRAGDCDLQITNAQTKDEYTDDEGLIPKGSSVIVRRIPIIGLKSSTNSKTRNIERSDVQSHYAFGAVKAMNDQSSARAMPLFSKMANLADADVSEEDKIKVMINQSTYDSMNYSKKFGTVLPANYTCYRCGNTGHHIRNCPTSGQDKNFEAAVRLKKSTGIPRSFMVEVDDPNIKGAMLTNCGHYAIPAIHAKAYAIGKKEKPPFVSQEQIQSEEKEEPVPDELICVICHDLLSDAVVIPCCGNSYCDDCIRTSLLDSEHHICPTCSQSDVSPDTLIANKFLRQAVNTFKNERGRTKNPTATPSSVPTLLPITMQSIPQKRYQSTHSQQDPLLYNSQAADTPSSSQVCGAPPTAPAPASASNTPSMSLQPMQSHLDVSDKEAEEKTLDDSAAAAPSVLVSHKDPTAAASELIPVVDPTPEVEQPQTANVNLQQSSSGPAPGHSGPSTSWDSSPSSSGCPTGGWSESNTQQLPPSSSSTSYPPPLFPSPHFHAFLAAQQPLNSYPPGYPPATPIWTLPTPQGAPIPSLCPSTSASSIPALIPMEWYLHQRKKNEGSPHRGSTYKPSSSRSNSKSSKSKSSRSYSRSSSRSRSRSRSRSQGRSRPHSTYSNQKKPHTRSHSSRSYSYGYKRSPTPSSSSSPRVGYQSRSKSPSDHRKNSNHSRHHSKKSALSSSSSRRRGERSQREERGSERSNLYAQHANQTNSLELDRERYLQWKREYKEWCEKYFNSYVGHFHHLPPPLLSLPPSPLPQWGDSEGSRNPSNSESRNRLQGRGTARMDGCSPPSQSSSDSRSPPSQSSSDSRSTPSQSSSDSRSTPSNSSNDSRSPPSQSSSDGRSTPSEYGAQQRCAEKYSHLPVTFSKSSKETQLQERSKDDKQLIAKNLKNLSNLKQEQKNMKKHKEGKGEESSSPDAADSTDDCRKDKRRHNIGPNACEDGTRVQDKAPAIEALESAKPLVKPDKHLYKDYERKSRDQRNLESEKGRRRSKNSDSGQDVGRQHKEKSSKGAGRLDTGRSRSPGGSKASDSRSESRKRKGEDMERSSVKAASSECLKTNIAEVPETHKGESQSPFDRKKPKTERKTWPLTERDIWEGGIKVKPQKKISININLDGKRKEENTAKTDLSYLESITGKTKEEIENTGNGEEEKLNRGGTEINKVNEKKESSRDQEGVSEEKIKPDEREARPIWEKATFRDEEREVWEKKDAGEKKQDKEEEVFDMWHCALRGVEEESKKQSEEQAGMEAEKGEEVTNDERRTARGGEEEEWKVRNDSGGQEMGALVTGTQKERAEGESICKENRENLPGESKPNEELMKGMKWRKVEEGDMTRSKSQRSRDESRHDRPDTTVEDGSSCEDHQESKMVVNTQDMAADGEDELILIQVPRSKWDKEESVEEEQDEGEIKVQTEALAVFRSSSSVSVTAETPPNRETEGENERQRQRGRDRAREKNNTLSSSHRSVAPSSGKDRTDSIFSAERKMEMERPRDREREREKQRQKGSKRSEERKREGERGRDMERERGHSLVQKRNPPSSSHSYSYSTSHDTERRDRQRGGDQGSNKSSSCPSGKSSSGRSWESSAMSRAAELPDQNPHKAYKGRDMLLDLKFNDKDHHYYDHNAQDPSGNRHQDRPAGTHHSPRSLSHNRGKERDPLPFKSSGGSEPKWEAEERPNSNSSSTSQESSSDDRREEWKKKQKKHKQEKRQPAPELLEEGELKKHKHKKSKTSKDGGEEESSGEGDDKWKEEEDHSKLYSVMLF